MKIQIHQYFKLTAVIGILTSCVISFSTASAQGVVPKVSAPKESGKRLPAELIFWPVIFEFFDAPTNTKSIEEDRKEYSQTSTVPVTEYKLTIQVDPQEHTITESATPINIQELPAIKKIYITGEPNRLQRLKCYSKKDDDWVLEEEFIYDYPGMGGNSSLPMRKTQIVKGKDTTKMAVSYDDTYVYDEHMKLVEILTKSQTKTYKYNPQGNLASEKITTAADWRLLEYVYQYENGLWTKKDEFETTSDQKRHLKSSISRKVTLQ